jgi:hypothetical protein
MKCAPESPCSADGAFARGYWRNAALAVVAVLGVILPTARGKEPTMHPNVFYRKMTVDCLNIFYREAGPKNGPTILLLHGFPLSSTAPTQPR